MRILAILAAASLALPAAATTLELAPSGSRALPAGEWSRQGDAVVAPAHPLAPTVSLGPGAVLQVELPGAGALRMVPAGVTTRTTQPFALPPGEARLAESSSASGAVVSESWIGIDEAFSLRSGEVKHDLLVSQGALGLMGRGDFAASWLLELPAGVRAALAADGGVALARGNEILARVPPALVADADDPHWSSGVARFELAGPEGSPTLTLVVPAAWAFDAARAFPLRLDPTISLQPVDTFKTGFVDELGNEEFGSIDTGSLLLVGFGAQVRGFAEFDTSSIPDGATINDTHLRIWLANHDNPGDPAVPLRVEVKGVGVQASEPAPVLWATIGALFTGVIYTSEDLPRTGPEFCPDSYVFRDYDLGSTADADVAAQLPFDFFTLGFASEIVTDPTFDHVDYIGFPEEVDNPFGCAFTDFPGTRITLVIDYVDPNEPPVCNAGGPYVADCPIGSIFLDGTGSFDPNGDPIAYVWTTDCPGTISGASLPVASLQLDGGCVADCTVTLQVHEVVSGITSTSCTATVHAQDLTPPVVDSSDLVDLCLWPPRHDMYCVGSAAGHVVAHDACQPGVIYRWVGCASDQPDEAREDGRPENGDGHFDQDCQVNAAGELCVRVERAGFDPVAGRNTFEGRRYSVSVEVDDGCGNVVVVPGTVHVPHDRRGGSGGQDDPCESGSKLK